MLFEPIKRLNLTALLRGTRIELFRCIAWGVDLVDWVVCLSTCKLILVGAFKLTYSNYTDAC